MISLENLLYLVFVISVLKFYIMSHNNSFRLFSVLMLCLIIPFNSFSQKENSKNRTSSWSYLDEKNGGFEYISIKEVKLPKQAKKYFEGMKMIIAGTFTMGKTSTLNANERDSTLITTNPLKRVTLMPYYISDHEVSNKEYREFVNWVIDSVKLAFLARTDPSFYKDASNHVLDWDKRYLFLTEENQKKMEPLYHSEFERFYKTPQFDVKNAVYSEVYNNDTFSIEIYPDTTCWTSEFPYSYIEPMQNNYFWHPAYNTYPVVGVSYKQAKAYCKWRTKMINMEICRANKFDFNKATQEGNPLLLPEFRLPSEAEWEYAARAEFSKEKIIRKNPEHDLFPWSGNNLFDEEGNCYANFGTIKDENGFEVKSFQQNNLPKKKLHKFPAGDFYVFQAPVMSFKPNGYGLYNMAGNVAEWVLDAYKHESFDEINTNDNKKNVFSKDSLTDTLKNRKDSSAVSIGKKNKTNIYCKEHIKTNNREDSLKTSKLIIEKAEREIHNAEVAKRYQNARVVKGGSWFNGPAYMQCGSKEIFPEYRGSTRIGFRVCMTVAGIKSDEEKK
jgi:formylglycine-generating enzyme required for sulfatase activity